MRTCKLAAIAAIIGLSQLAIAAPDSRPPDAHEGTLNIVWGDPHRQSGLGGETRFTLVEPDGKQLRLDLQGRENAALRHFGKRVHAKGRKKAIAGQPGLDVDSLSAAIVPMKAAAAEGAPAVGTKKVLYLLAKFSDDVAVPHPPQFYNDLNNPDVPPVDSLIPATINGFYKKTSWNQFAWNGDVGGTGGVPATGWLTLPHSKAYYAPCGWSSACANLTALANDAMSAGAAAGISYASYDNINLVLSNDLDCCAWGGSHSYGGKTFGFTWEPPWGQETGTYAHELGHSLGLPHSGWVYFAYDSPWDVMSMAHRAASQTLCGSYASANDSYATSTLYCDEPGDGFIAAHKDVLGWIPIANQVVTDDTSAVTATLDGQALALGEPAKMIKVCLTGEPCSGSSAHYLTVEARVKALGPDSQFDNGIPGEGVVIHDFQDARGSIGIGNACFFNSSSGWAVPIDATPGDYDNAPTCSHSARAFPDYELYNAQWLPGQEYVDAVRKLRISVLSRTGSSFDVRVSPLLADVGNVTAVPGNTEVTLTWAAAAGATSYAVLQGTASGGEDPTPVASGITGRSVVVGGLTNGTTYFFQVIPVNGGGAGDPSSEVSATPRASLPEAPAGLTAVAGGGKVTLKWNAAAGAFRYRILQGTAPGGESATPVKTNLATTSTTISGLTNGTRYYFQVVAVNGSSVSAPSNEASAVPIAPPSALIAKSGNAKVVLTWASGAGASKYRVLMGTSAGGESVTPIKTGIIGNTTTITGLANGTKYYFKVVGYDGTSASTPSNEASAVPIAPPTSLAAVKGSHLVKLTWSAGAGALSYRILQGTVAGGESATPVKSGIAGTSTTISGLASGTRYYFKVVAVNGASISAPSNEASAVPSP